MNMKSRTLSHISLHPPMTQLSSSTSHHIHGIGIDITYIPRFTAILKKSIYPRLLEKILHPNEIHTIQQMIYTYKSAYRHSLIHSNTYNNKHIINTTLHDNMTSNDLISLARWLSSEWCIKEALVKATSYRLLFPDIEIIRESHSKPNVIYHNTVHQYMIKHNVTNTHISLSHDQDYTIAMVVLESNNVNNVNKNNVTDIQRSTMLHVNATNGIKNTDSVMNGDKDNININDKNEKQAQYHQQSQRRFQSLVKREFY